MKIARCLYEDKTLWGLVDLEHDRIITSIEGTKGLLDFRSVMDFFDVAESADELYTDRIKLSDVEWLAPVLPTKNVLCIGKNYYDHILEFDGSAEDVARIKETPIFFSKSMASITGHNREIDLHSKLTSQVDYEAELAVIIGKSGSNIPLEKAYDYIYGYTILNDVTARDLQGKHQQWFKGKSLDTHCPIGPWLVTKDEVKNPQKLAIKSLVNGQVRQDANTELMIHTIAAQVSELSKGMTLCAGDVIATGTPKGVGMGFKPPRFLKTKDEVEIRIDEIGSLRNVCK